MNKDIFSFENNFYLNVSPKRLSKFITRLDLYKRILNLRGEIVECGVFKGISLMQLVKIRSIIENDFSRKIIAFDTFSKFPDGQDKEERRILKKFIKEAGDKSISKTKLTSLLKRLNLNNNVELIKGNILKTGKKFINDNPALKIALLHIDVDLYDSTKSVLENFYPNVVLGGIVILDDYGAFPGANKAIEEYFLDQEIIIEQPVYSNQISYIIKKRY